MASAFSHVALPLALGVGVGRKTVPRRLLLLGMFLSIAPDLDVLAFFFGIPYESPWGHRGFTHSIVFSSSVALLSVPFANVLGSNRATVFIFSFFSMLSHGVFDALTNGGLGVAFFWPFEDRRYFFPWTPIDVSPIAVNRFFTKRAWSILRSELVYLWLPSFALSATIACLKKLLPISKNRAI